MRSGWSWPGPSSQPAWRAAHLAALPFARMALLVSLVAAALGVSAQVLADAAGVSHVAPVVAMVTGYLGFLIVRLLATRAANRAVRSC